LGCSPVAEQLHTIAELGSNVKPGIAKKKSHQPRRQRAAASMISRPVALRF
jgi:hypothetical protein